MSIRALLILLLAATALSGCGRRGALESPPKPDVSAVAGQPGPAEATAQGEPAPAPGSDALFDQGSTVPGAFPDQESPGAQEPAEAAPGGRGRQGFVLDPLI